MSGQPQDPANNDVHERPEGVYRSISPSLAKWGIGLLIVLCVLLGALAYALPATHRSHLLSFLLKLGMALTGAIALWVLAWANRTMPTSQGASAKGTPGAGNSVHSYSPVSGTAYLRLNLDNELVFRLTSRQIRSKLVSLDKYQYLSISGKPGLRKYRFGEDSFPDDTNEDCVIVRPQWTRATEQAALCWLDTLAEQGKLHIERR